MLLDASDLKTVGKWLVVSVSDVGAASKQRGITASIEWVGMIYLGNSAAFKIL